MIEKLLSSFQFYLITQWQISLFLNTAENWKYTIQCILPFSLVRNKTLFHLGEPDSCCAVHTSIVIQNSKLD